MPQNLFLCHTVWAYVGTLRLHSVAGITEKNASPHIGVEFDRFTSSVRGGGESEINMRLLKPASWGGGMLDP